MRTPSETSEDLNRQAALPLAHRILESAKGETPGLLRRMGFRQPRQAIQILDRLARPRPGMAPLPAEVLAALALTGIPDRGLRHFERYIDISGSRLFLYSRFRESPPLVESLAQIFSHSVFLTDILVRNPEYLLWLFDETPYLRERLDRQTLRRELTREADVPGDPRRRLDILLRAQRRELLRIGAAEILSLKSVDQIGLELADLADVVVDLVLREVSAEMVRRFGRPHDERGKPAQFCIVSLGKHGGRELNYSSDIDLMFVYDGEGETKAGRNAVSINNNEYFNRFGERLVQALTEMNPEGFFYRVDMRLRPEGAQGPLARSLRSFWIYYESRGELWERQMLIKARRVAGSRQLWRRFADMLVRFIYPAHFKVTPLEAIRQVKERIEAQIAQRPRGENNIKLQAGGIRDIEFVVQCLQLLGGRIDARVRHANTLEGITRLRSSGALTAGEAQTLERAYRFYRRLENLLQIQGDRSVYAVPDDRAEAAALARLLELPGSRCLRTTVRQCVKQVRAIYDDLFYNEAETAGHPAGDDLKWLTVVGSDNPRVEQTLAEYGFRDTAAMHRTILQFVDTDTLSTRARDLFAELLPALLASLTTAADPNQGMVRFTRLVHAYGAPGSFFALLQASPNFMELLVAICGSSRFLAELIQRDPSLLDGLVTPNADEGALEKAGRRGDPGAMVRYRNQGLVRIGTEDLLGLIPTEETFLQLSELAEAVLQMAFGQALRVVTRRRGKPRDRQGKPARFACLAGGKFGGRELVFGSDLDLFFVYDGDGITGRSGMDNGQFYSELAQEIIRLLGTHDLYEVDARLRPEGRSAPMVISLQAYRRYLADRASTWERLALTRTRFVAGDPGLGRQVQRAIDRFISRDPVDAAMVGEIVHVRQRMEPKSETGKGRQLDIKRGAGGLVDVEFIAQIHVVKWAGKRRSLRLTSARQVLDQLTEKGIVDAADGRFLLQAYDRFREVEKAIRIASNQGIQVLPDGHDLVAIERAVGIDIPGGLVPELTGLMAKTRSVFNRLIATI